MFVYFLIVYYIAQLTLPGAYAAEPRTPLGGLLSPPGTIRAGIGTTPGTSALSRTIDPASIMVSVMRIFQTLNKFSGMGNNVRQHFMDFHSVLLSTLSMWDRVPTVSGYTLKLVLSQAPSATDADDLEFSHIIFRILLHTCTDTALRLVSAERATEDGFAAFQRLIRRYSSVTISTIGDLQEKIQCWSWPAATIDPSDSTLLLSEWYNLLETYGIPTPDVNRVTFLLGKLRSSVTYRILPVIWGGSDYETFKNNTSSLDIFERVYAY